MARPDYDNARALLVCAIIGSKLVLKILPPIDRPVALVASLAAVLAPMLGIVWFAVNEMRKGGFQNIGFWLPALTDYLGFTSCIVLVALIVNLIPLAASFVP